MWQPEQHDEGWTRTLDNVLDMYGQEVYWYNATGEAHIITHMSTRYLCNLVQWFQRNVRAVMWDLSLRLLDRTNHWMGTIGGEQARDDLEHAWSVEDEQLGDWQVHPWEIPLVKAACHELGRRYGHHV